MLLISKIDIKFPLIAINSGYFLDFQSSLFVKNGTNAVQ